MKLVLIMFILTFLSLPAVVNAQNLTLDANFHTISVIASFSTTPSGVTVEYKRSTESTWRSYDSDLVYIDTRATLARSNTANYLQNTARFKIFGLSPNTLYDVRVTFDGSTVLTGQVTTLDTTPPAPSLRTIYVDPVNGNDASNGLSPSAAKRSIQGAFNIAQAGDRIWLKPATYTLSSTAILYADGTSSNWIRITKWEGESGDVIVEGDGGSIAPIIRLRGSYVRIDNLIIRKSTGAVLELASNPSGQESWRWIDNNRITDWDTSDVILDANAGIKAYNNPERTIIIDNILQRRDAVTGSLTGGGYAIIVKTDSSGGALGGRNIVWHNTITGGFDGISDVGEGNDRGGWYINSDIYENTITYQMDNAIQLDGAAINTAAFNNIMRTVHTGPSVNPIIVGPAYVFRNEISDLRDFGGPWGPGGQRGYKLGNLADGMTYVMHESLYLTGDYNNISERGGGWSQTNSGLANFWIRNSAWQTNRYVIETTSKQGDGGVMSSDYNSLWNENPDQFIEWWYNYYTNLAAYRVATGNEANGLSRNMAALDWVDAVNGNFALKSGSPLIDTGMVINGINNDVEDSSWNYKGSAPDIGAVEYDGGAPPTFGFTIATNPNSGSVIQGSSTTTTVTAALTSGSTQSVSFSSSGLPTGASPSFSPTSCSPTCSSTMTITTSSTTPGGTSTITVTGTGGGVTRTTGYSLTVSSVDTTPPVRSNGQPTGILAAGSTQTTISLTTNEAATCRYSTSAGITYDSMTNTFTTTGGTSHSSTVAVSSSSSYNYYVKCSDAAGNKNTDDFTISFSVASGAGIPFTFIADVTTEETALGMVEYNNDLYIAVHTDPKNNGPGTIVRYNDLTGTYGTAYSIPSGQGLGDIRVLNSRIYVTSLDFDGNNAGWIYNGPTWQQWTMSGPAGLLDIDYYNSRYYTTGYGGVSAGTPKLYSSLTGNSSWSEVYSGSPEPNRFSQMVVFNSKLFFTPQISNQVMIPGYPIFTTDIFSYDGTTFTPINFTTEPMEVTDMEVFNNALYLSIWSSNTSVTGMWRTTDGVTFSQVSFFGPSPSKTPKLSDLVVYNNKLYAAEFNTSSVLLYESSDGTNWIQTSSVPATASVYGTGSGYNHVALGVYRGRLYAIPPAQGRLYVLSVIPADTTPPTISNITSVYSTVSANITWNTDDLSNSTVNYGTTTAVASTASDTSLVTSHRISIIGLLPNTTYYYQVRSCNSVNLCSSSSIRNFTTNTLPSGEVCVDSDNDNFFAVSTTCSSGNDCNDASAAVNPSAAEVCGNGIDENCDGVDDVCPQPPPSGNGGVTPIGPPLETPITKEPENKTTENVSQTTGSVSLEMISPDRVESGEMFNATVWMLSPIKASYILTVGDVKQLVELEAGKEEMLVVPVRAPEAKGSYTLTAAVAGTSRARDIELDYKPLFMYVDENRVGNETFVNITVKNYEELSTELRVIKDGRSDAFFELIEGKKEYNRQLKLTQAGEYKIIATASSEGKIVDTDEYLLTVGGEKGSDYRLILIIVFAFVVMVITLVVMIR